MISRASCFLAVVTGALTLGASARATVPSGFLETLVTEELSHPTAMAFAPDGRLFVAEQGGTLRVIKNGSLLPTPFVTVPVDPNGERGLLGVAFDPTFDTATPGDDYVYAYYTVPGFPPHNRVSRFIASGDLAVEGSEVPILDLEDLGSSWSHNGGAIAFGPDGKLYVAVGENATASNAQSLTNRLGKILRINSDGSIPIDNPFYDRTISDNRSIWAIGLRNPFKFAFQPGTGRMFINDVGETSWEEINEGIAGGNYGWPETEGPTMDPRFRGPIFAYGHEPRVGPTTGCAITGGAFYNPDTRQFPADYVGDYFFADLCGEWMRRFDLSTGSATDFVSGRQLIVDVVVSNDGSVYYLTYGTGGVYRITAVPTAARIGSVTARRNRTAAAISRDCTIPARHQLDVREQNRRFVRVDESEREFSGPIPTRLPLRGVAPSTRPSCIGST